MILCLQLVAKTFGKDDIISYICNGRTGENRFSIFPPKMVI